MEQSYFEKVEEAKKYLEGKIKIKPKVMLVLSGGLSKLGEKVEDPVDVSAKDIPHFPRATTEGHSGKIIFGSISGLPLAIFQGRFHFYEGHKMSDIVFPVFVMNSLGAGVLVATNAAGGVNKLFKPGDIMLVTDHINCLGTNPLIGIATQRPENQFPDMTDAYSSELWDIARRSAKEAGFELKEGVYIAVTGPSYETKAEIKAFRSWGADSVGMSVVPEVIAANFLGMKTLVFSCIANVSADLHHGGMNHHEVLTTMKNMEDRLVKLLLVLIGKLR